MIKNALIQSIVNNRSDVKQINTIHLKNTDWEFAVHVIMLLLNAVINKSSIDVLSTTDLDEPFTAEIINKSIDRIKEIIDNENKLYDNPCTIDVQTPNPLNELIDIIDKVDKNEKTKTYVSINWCIENNKINLSKTMITGIENLFERKYINDPNNYNKVVKNILNEMPITDPIL